MDQGTKTTIASLYPRVLGASAIKPSGWVNPDMTAERVL